MKNLLSYIIAITGILFSTFPTLAYTNADSLSYEMQREKVNNLLEERREKFGEYDLSLQQRTGIFGLFQTKSDMQKSLDILKDVILNDNAIFIETKKLLDLKDYEKAHYQKLAAQYDDQTSAYMKTVSKLQKENERLREKITELEDTDHSNDILLYIAILCIIGLSVVIFLLYIRNRGAKSAVESQQ